MGLVNEDAMQAKQWRQDACWRIFERCISQEHLSLRLYSNGTVFLAKRVVIARCVVESTRAGVDQRGSDIAGIALLPDCDKGLNSGTIDVIARATRKSIRYEAK